MNLTEKDLLEKCKKDIEIKLNWSQESTPKQRDFEFLLDLIEEKSKISISLSTIKRIWEKESNIMPQISTLNALAIFLDYSDWLHFKKEHLINLSVSNDVIVKRKSKKTLLFILFGVVLLIVISSFYIYKSKIISNNKFADNISIKVILPTDKQLPQHVILKYEIKDTSLTDYYIKPFYNPAYLFKLDKAKNQIEFPYAYPGCYTINVISESHIVRIFKVKIATSGWISAIFKSVKNIYFSENELIENGELVIKEEFFAKKKEHIDSLFHSGFYFVDKLPNINGDNFVFEARIKCLKTPIELPNNINIGFRNENFNSSFPLIFKKTMYDAECKFGNTVFKNNNNVLNPLICNIYEWQKIRFEVRNGNFKIFVNDEMKYQNIYFEKAGKLEGFCFIFPGLGAVDYVRLYNLENKIIYKNEFE